MGKANEMIDAGLITGFIFGAAIGLGMAFGVTWAVRRVK